jgi:hypothetical protein
MIKEIYNKLIKYLKAEGLFKVSISDSLIENITICDTVRYCSVDGTINYTLNRLGDVVQLCADVNIEALLSNDEGNSIVIGSDGRIYVNTTVSITPGDNTLFTPYIVPFIDSSGDWDEDTNFNYLNGKLGIGLDYLSVDARVHIKANSGNILKIDDNLGVNVATIDNAGNLSYHGDALYVDVVNDRVGIGTSTPYASLTIVSQGSNNTRSVVGEHYDNTTAFSQFKIIGSRARGNRGNPSAVLANDSLASFNGRGYKTTGWSDTVGGMYVYANGNWTNASTPTYITFRGVNTGTTVTEWARLNNIGLGIGINPTANLHVKGNSDTVGNAFRVESLTGNRLIIGNDGKHAINTTVDTNFNLKIQGEDGLLFTNAAATRFIRFRLNNSGGDPLDIRLNNTQGNSQQMFIRDRDGNVNFKTSFASGAGYYIAIGAAVSESPFAYTAPGLRILGALNVQGTHNVSTTTWNDYTAVGVLASGDISTNTVKQSTFSIQSNHANTDISKQFSMLHVHYNTSFTLTSGSTNGIVRGVDINYVINQTGGSTRFIGIDYQPTITSLTGAHYGLLIRPNTLNGFGLGSTLPTANLQVKSASDALGTILKVDSNTLERFRVDSNGNAYSNGLHMFGTSGDIPQVKVDVNASNGYDQLVLRTAFTPANSGDSNGFLGNICWDDNYIYIKTSGGGWKRATLSTF